ncbi:ABC transporter permease [bacterium]|nr:MAG: ABC transporter permease [bacterium]
MIRIGLLVAAGIVLVIGLLLATGISPAMAGSELIAGAFGSPRAISGSLRETTPLLFAGLAVFLALRAGLFNIGAEGQLVVGAAATAAVALKFPGPIGIVLGMVAGMVAGALWAWPAGAIRAYRNGHEVITTIMLNRVAVLATDWLVGSQGPLRDPTTGGTTTAVLPRHSRLPDLLGPPLSVSSGLLLGLILAGGLWWWLGRTVAGYELRAAGANPTAARFAGVEPQRVMVRAMLSSGALAGLGGAVQVLAFEGRFYQGFSPGYGFDALGVALLAAGNALWTIPAALLFGALSQGGTRLGISGVPKEITGVILGVVILIAGALRYRRVRTVA